MSTVRLPASCLIKSRSPTKAASLSRSCAWIKSLDSLASVRNVSKKFGLKSSSFKVSAMTVYKIKLLGPNGEEKEIDAPDDTYILESIEGAGLDVPYACRIGACRTCVVKLVSGSVDLSDGLSPDEEEEEKGHIRICVSVPTSDCVIQPQSL